VFTPSACTKKAEDISLYQNAFIVVVQNRHIACVPINDNLFRLPFVREFGEVRFENSIVIGEIDGITCLSADLCCPQENMPSDPLRMEQERIIFGKISADTKNALSRALEIARWRKQHIFCGVCTAPLNDSSKDIGRICPKCGACYYPQLAPAVIIGILRNNGKEILLAHNRRFVSNIYGLIAGFIEAGESAEQAIHREILEETGISVCGIRYYASQCWPFPNSLMLGFIADYESGYPMADGTELETLDWFSKGNMPEIPQPGSIAREIIDAFLRDEFVQ